MVYIVAEPGGAGRAPAPLPSSLHGAHAHGVPSKPPLQFSTMNQEGEENEEEEEKEKREGRKKRRKMSHLNSNSRWYTMYKTLN
jgi:hypothetical protein